MQQPKEMGKPLQSPEKKTSAQLKKEFEEMVGHYLDSNPVLPKMNKTSELEIRFASNPRIGKPTSKIEYDNVVKQLYSCGFTPENETGIQLLRIRNQYMDAKTGFTKMSNIRAEIVGTDLIQEYCRTNDIQKIINMPSHVAHKVIFTQKTIATRENGAVIRPVDNGEFNFRSSYQYEQDFHVGSGIISKMIREWNDSKKEFRCLNRVRFTHPDYPIFVDLSIVKMSKRSNKVMIPYYTIQEANVFQSPSIYEIEIEVDNHRVGYGTDFNELAKLLTVLRKCIRIVLSGLQGSKYPISVTERDIVLQQYAKILYGDEFQQHMKRRIPFIGPDSNTLQIENIQYSSDNTSKLPNIRSGYTVTDKADGERKLLFVANDGKMYFIDKNMTITFTGSKTIEKTIFNTIIDGEHIKYDKNHKYINLYAAFDLYYLNTKSTRELAFVNTSVNPITSENPESDYRLLLLYKLTELIKPFSVLNDSENKTLSNDLRIKCKQFEVADEHKNIFQCCSNVFGIMKDDLYEYNTDGIIFTPSNTGVGSNKVGAATPFEKRTWPESFKWKPSEYNTIDFLVSVKKDKNGKDEIHHVFENGTNLQGVHSMLQYKTLILRCGFNPQVHASMNPCQAILDDNIVIPENMDKSETYKPVPFYPTEPYDPNACFCNIYLHRESGSMIMKTEENEYFEEDMIVEFKYVKENASGWNWVPIRVRYDKTADLRNGGRNFGNAYHVANNNWHSIHHPVTKEMLSTGENIKDTSVNDDVYYNPNNVETSTRGLRDFHNLYVKKKLIRGVSKRGDTLIDYAVGKAGDLAKWNSAKLSFVLGIDIHMDNIHNHLNGACARFLESKKKYTDMYDAMFLVGNSSLNIRSGQAFKSQKDKMVIRSVFGNGPKDPQVLGRGVYKQYGRAQNGFQISSCQFALHYFFENKRVLHSFLRNLSECTKVNGYFVGTCYDGQTVFNMLRKKEKGESITLFKGDRKIFEIVKEYDQTGFPEDEESVGYAIDIYQESINKKFREFLVNFKYLTRLMEDYGFILVKKEEAIHMQLPNSTGLFSELFQSMHNEITANRQAETYYGESNNMSDEEKRISFMNRYFIFKKVRNENVEKLAKIIEKEEQMLQERHDEVTEFLENEVTVVEKEKEIEKEKMKIKMPSMAKKIKKKIVLNKYDTPEIPTTVTKSPTPPEPATVPAATAPASVAIGPTEPEPITEIPIQSNEPPIKLKKLRIKEK